MKNNILAILAALVLVLIIAGLIYVSHQQAVHKRAIENIATFGEQHKYENFMLKKGTCLRIKTEIGDVLICLPDEGQPALLVAPDTFSN